MNSDREHMSRQCRAHLARCAAIEQERRLMAVDLAIARQLRGEPPTPEDVKRDVRAGLRFVVTVLVGTIAAWCVYHVAVWAWRVCNWEMFYV